MFIRESACPYSLGLNQELSRLPWWSRHRTCDAGGAGSITGWETETTPPSQNAVKSGIVNLGTTDIWGWIILCCGGYPVPLQCLAASLALPTRHQSHLPIVMSQISPDCHIPPLRRNCPQLRIQGLD